MKESKIFIISGPSGAGEDSVIEGLREFIPIERVITTTSREMRAGESQKNPYYFITPEEFKQGLEQNKFLEYAKEYNDKYYGVTFDEMDRVRKSGKTGIWKMEYKGVKTAKKLYPEMIAILINASEEDLIKRIKARSQVTEEYLQERMAYTKEWLKHKEIYDYEVVNEQDKLDETIQKVLNIIKKNS